MRDQGQQRGALQQFEFEGTLLRTVEIDGEPWFVAKDVATVLGYRSASDMTRTLGEDAKGTHQVETLGGRQCLGVISEPALYHVVLQRQDGWVKASELRDQVKRFQRWVTHEVLPQIRQTGAYGAVSAAHPDMLTRSDLARMVIEAEEEKAAAVAQLEAAAPKVAYHDRYVANDDAVTVKVWAAQFGLSEPQARALLLERKVIYSQVIGQKYSARENRVVEVREYRAYARFIEWFDLRPQHNAPRHHNGQVRQTLYVRQEAALQLGQKLGLEPLGAAAQPSLEVAV